MNFHVYPPMMPPSQMFDKPETIYIVNGKALSPDQQEALGLHD